MVANLVISIIVVADCLPQFRREISGAATAVIAAGFSLSPNLHNFRFSSLLSLLAALIILCTVVASPADTAETEEINPTLEDYSKAWGCSLFAFSFAINVPRLTMEIPKADRDTLPLILSCGVIAATLFYFSFTAAALRVFRSPPQNYIFALEEDRFCRFVLVLSTVTKMPLSAHPAREMLLDYLRWPPWVITGCLLLVVYVIFVYSGSLASSVSLVGACGSLSASFIFPCLLLKRKTEVEADQLIDIGLELKVMDSIAIAATSFALPCLVFMLK